MERTSNTAVVVKPEKTSESVKPRICMHVLGIVRTDARVLREANALVQAGYMVTIVDIEEKRTQPYEEYLNDIRLKHMIMPSWFIPSRFKPWFLVKLAQILARGIWVLLRIPADIYHAHDDNALFACCIAALLRRKPLIYDAHDLPLDSPQVTHWPLLHTIAINLLSVMMRRCSAVICPSPPLVQELQQRYGGPKALPIRNIPPYQPPVFSNRLRDYLGLGPEIRIALYQGNVQSNRNLDTLVYAAPFLDPNIVIVIMGKAEEPTRVQLEDLIVSKGVADRVKIIPPVPYEELLYWTASADIGLTIYQPDYSPNVRFCLPNKFFEYLMVGLPVLTSPLDAIIELIKFYNVGRIVSSLAPVDIAASINTMLADLVALSSMRLNAFEVAKHEFCWERESLQLIDLYHKIHSGL